MLSFRDASGALFARPSYVADTQGNPAQSSPQAHFDRTGLGAVLQGTPQAVPLTLAINHMLRHFELVALPLETLRRLPEMNPGLYKLSVDVHDPVLAPQEAYRHL